MIEQGQVVSYLKFGVFQLYVLTAAVPVLEGGSDRFCRKLKTTF